ncbi:MAG: RCC1 domain-containing protein, partial [Candidatus Sumerlaeota bacterium]|nr:RCC1 domain-containing protein [Candidatus Sumerlaeota bacterium]
MKSKPWSVKLVLVIATMAIAAMLLNCGATWAAKSGSIVAWGDNTYGQCDVPTTNSDFVAIAAGYSHSLGITTSTPPCPNKPTLVSPAN